MAASWRPWRWWRRWRKSAEVPQGLESEWVYMWVADSLAAGPATRVRKLTGRVIRGARKALRPKA